MALFKLFYEANELKSPQNIAQSCQMNFPTWERINTHSTLLCCTQSGIGWGNIKQNCMLQSLMTADLYWFTHWVCAVIQLMIMDLLLLNLFREMWFINCSCTYCRQPILSEMLLHWKDLPVSLEKWHQKSWSMHRSSWRYRDNEEAVLS